MYANWEKPIEAWAKKNNYVAKAPAMESCDLRAGQGTTSVSILSPTSNTTVTSASLPIEVGTSADTVSVQYTIDGTVVASSSAAPFSTTLDLSAQENGFHTIRAIATTSAGTTGSSTITINLLVKDSGAVQYFITPAPNSTVPSNSFPRTVKIFAYDPAGVRNVTLSMKNPDGSVVVLDTIDNPAEQSVTFSWPTTLPGAYELFFTVKNKKNATTQSDNLKITVS
jgi:hypothetical protein